VKHIPAKSCEPSLTNQIPTHPATRQEDAQHTDYKWFSDIFKHLKHINLLCAYPCAPSGKAHILIQYEDMWLVTCWKIFLAWAMFPISASIKPHACTFQTSIRFPRSRDGEMIKEGTHLPESHVVLSRFCPALEHGTCRRVQFALLKQHCIRLVHTAICGLCNDRLHPWLSTYKQKSTML
jgi:hypothetical protein